MACEWLTKVTFVANFAARRSEQVKSEARNVHDLLPLDPRSKNVAERGFLWAKNKQTMGISL